MSGYVKLYCDKTKKVNVLKQLKKYFSLATNNSKVAWGLLIVLIQGPGDEAPPARVRVFTMAVGRESMNN